VLLLTLKQDVTFGIPVTIEYIYHTFTFQSLLLTGVVSEYFMTLEGRRAPLGTKHSAMILSARVKGSLRSLAAHHRSSANAADIRRFVCTDVEDSLLTRRTTRVLLCRRRRIAQGPGHHWRRGRRRSVRPTRIFNHSAVSMPAMVYCRTVPPAVSHIDKPDFARFGTV